MTDPTRLDALEIKAAHLERALQELSDMVYRQQQDIERVRRGNQQLVGHIQALESGVDPAGGSATEIPPHY